MLTDHGYVRDQLLLYPYDSAFARFLVFSPLEPGDFSAVAGSLEVEGLRDFDSFHGLESELLAGFDSLDGLESGP